MPSNEVQAYFDTLYHDIPEDAYHVASWRSRPDAPLKHKWMRAAQVNPEGIANFAQKADIWLGIGLRHPDCTPQDDARGTNEDVYAIPGLWVDLDHKGGTHTAKNLPTQDELLHFIGELPFRFSFIVDTSGGYHGYVLFKELWVLDTPDEHQQAALLLRRFQRTIQMRALERGWRVDSTADLSRILRLPGTLNHKTKPPRPVTILHEGGVRYNPLDLETTPWLATVEDTYTPSSASNGDFPPTQLEPIVQGCAWLRHCRDDAATLPEPEWYSMLSIIGRCVEREQIAHEWSAPYPRYTAAETTQKLRHACSTAHAPVVRSGLI